MQLGNSHSWDASRRDLVAGAGALALFGCKPQAIGAGSVTGPVDPSVQALTIKGAVAGSWRSAEDRARDKWRHPAQSLDFWGVKPGMTVVEFWPGSGWYTEILGPFLAATGGHYYAAVGPDTPAGRKLTEVYRQKLASKPKLYGQVQITAFNAASGPVASPGTADVVLFLRNLHDWMAGAMAEKAFHDAREALKPGGVLGIEEHRAPPGGAQDILAKNGYVQQAYVRQMAEEAGFIFDKASEINANPKDDHNHPFGVWTLPPSRLTAPRDMPPDPKFNRAKYDAIGESDRMTLRFIKKG